MNFFVPKLSLNQHRVLERIYDVPSVYEFPNMHELGNSLNMSEDEVMQAAHLLKGRGFAFINRDKRPFVVGCTPEGAQALLQKVLLEEGKEKAKSNALRWMQMGGIIIAASISICTFVINTVVTVNNSKTIEGQRIEIAYLKERAEKNENAMKILRSNQPRKDK
jgi:hypothetical protein